MKRMTRKIPDDGDQSERGAGQGRRLPERSSSRKECQYVTSIHFWT
jgi:hypothetical protein